MSLALAGLAVLLVGLGAWATLDTTSLGQLLVSRPLVGGTLAGSLLGDPVSGALAGGLLELLVLGALPVGAVRLPEPGAGGVVAGAVAALPSISLPALPALPAGPSPGGSLALAIVLGVLLAWVGGWSQERMRAGNARRVEGEGRRARAHRRSPARGRLHARCLLVDAGRGASLTTLGLALAGLVLAAGAAMASAAGPAVGTGVEPGPPGLWPASRFETALVIGATGLLGLGRLTAVAAPSSLRRRSTALLVLTGGLAGAGLVLVVGSLGALPGGGGMP